MATTESFSTMLKHYMPHQMLVEEMKKRNYLWNMIEKDEKWMGGQYDVPFEGGRASSLSFGALTAAASITEDRPILGYISAQPELWGSMIFNEKDLDRHGSLEASFLKILPDRLKRFSENMAERVSLALLKGFVAKITTAASSGTTTQGTIIVDHPEFFSIGELVDVIDDDTAKASGYVKTINMNTKTLAIVDTMAGGVPTDLTAFTVAQNARVQNPNQDASGFTTLRSALLSAANGGSANLHNQVKATYPFLQALNISGSAITAANILEKLYDAFFDVRALGKGQSNEMWVSYKHFKNIVKGLELNRDFTVKDKASGYGFNSISLVGGDGSDMKIVALREMDDAEAMIIDPSALMFAGNNFFERKRHLDGNEFYLTRNTTGYNYIVDIKFFGDLVVKHPSHCGIVHSISY